MNVWTTWMLTMNMIIDMSVDENQIVWNEMMNMIIDMSVDENHILFDMSVKIAKWKSEQMK